MRTNSKLAKLADLKGRKVAVIPGTTTEQAVANTLSAVGAPATVVPVARPRRGHGGADRGHASTRSRATASC